MTNRHAELPGERFSYTVDQRKYRMPPTWIPRRLDRRVRTERGRAVHATGSRRELADRIVMLLRGARKKVVLSSFLLADPEVEDAILDTARRGVRVYVLLASEDRLDIEPTDGEFERAMRARHEKMLTRLGGWALFRSAPHFHAKAVLADPGGGEGAGLLLTANLTEEALERNDELAVELTPREVDEAFALFRWAFWEFAEHEIVDPDDRFSSVGPIGCVTHPEPSGRVLATSPEAAQLRDEAQRIVENASSELVVASFGWDENHAVVKAVCARARGGLPVTALVRVRESQMPALVSLSESGVRVLGFKWLHAKALCADGDMALTMSANLQPDGLDRGFELGVSLDGTRAKEAKERLTEWSRTARWELRASPELGDIDPGEAIIWRDGRLRDISVEHERRVDLGSVEAPPDIPPRPVNGLSELAHYIVYEWSKRASPDAKA